MKWLVDGADSTTGNEQTIVVDADSLEHARREATRRGMFVSSVREMELAEPVEPPNPLDELASARQRPSRAGGAVDYRTPQASAPPPPEYRGLLIGGRLACWVAYVYYAMGGILLIGVLASIFNSQSFAGPSTIIEAVIVVVFPLTVFAGGVICHMLGSAALALRDMARNSFR